MKHFMLLIAWLVLATVSHVVAAHEKPAGKLTGMYSSMIFVPESGDVIGDEALVVFSNRGYYVVFQGSEGEPYVPVVVPAKVSGSSITFTLPSTTDPRGTFRGTLIDDALTGTFSGNGQAVRFKRKASYWQ